MKTIKVLVFEPMTKPYVKEIEDTLEAKQAIVGGLIEPVYYFDDVIIVVNEESKLRYDNPANFLIENETGRIIDVVFGTAFFCCDAGEDFGSITDDLIKKYKSKFIRVDGMVSSENFIVVPEERLIAKEGVEDV